MLNKLKIPENLSVAQIIREHRLSKRKHDFDYHAFVLGQSPFPVPQSLQLAFRNSSKFGMYGSSTGLDLLKNEIIEFNKVYYSLEIDLNRVFISNGTKMLIYMLVSILDGTFILPTPSWVGYEPILKLLNKKYVKIRLNESNQYKLDLNVLDSLMNSVENPILILNNPHNPTGSLLLNEELKELTQICENNDAFVIADEIYGLLTYENNFVSMYKHYPKKTFMTQGISKDRSAAGYRLGVGILPTENQAYFAHQLNALASIMYTNVSTPIQHASVQAYSCGDDIKNYIHTVKEIHKMVGHYFSNYVNETLQINSSIPKSAFYLVLDFNDLKSDLEASGIANATKLSNALLQEPFYVAVVTGEAISVDESDLLARIALVDYDGDRVLKEFLSHPPKNDVERESFIKFHMQHMIDGFDKIKLFVENIKKASL